MSKYIFSNTNCCVPKCHSRASKDNKITFHQFPAENKKLCTLNLNNEKHYINVRQEWIRLLKIGKKVSKRMAVCSRHFQVADFIDDTLDNTRKRRRLKRSALPSLYLPLSSTDNEEIMQRRKNAAVRRANRLKERRKLDKNLNEEILADQTLGSSRQESEVEAAEALLCLDSTNAGPGPSTQNDTCENISSSANTHNCTPMIEEDDDTETQAHAQLQALNLYPPHLNYNSLSDKNLNTLTGISSNTLLDKLTHLLITTQNQKLATLTVKEQIVMSMMRIRLNLKFAALSIFFGLSATSLKTIFVTTIINLKRVLQSCIIFPSKEDILKTLPKCFAKFQNVRVVLDCTEIPVSKPKCLTCNINTYSNYKIRNTLKYMIGISPDGLITFVGLGYGGRASDKHIFVQSKLIEYLEPHNDAILVDKGFLIEDECAHQGITLIRPPFVKKGRLTGNEAILTRSIARARVHVERSIQRMKIFELLMCRVPWTLVPFFDDIMIVIAGIVNLSSPILSNKRF